MLFVGTTCFWRGHYFSIAIGISLSTGRDVVVVVIWSCLVQKGVLPGYIRVTKDTYDVGRMTVRTPGRATDEFCVAVGLHQGSALSPFLFTIVDGRAY